MPFDTRKHHAFPILCGHCSYYGLTDPKETSYGITICGLLALGTELCYILAARQCCPRRLQRTDHYCANCGALLAQAAYKKSEKVRRFCDGWKIDDYELDLEEDWQEVAERKKKENAEKGIANTAPTRVQGLLAGLDEVELPFE